MGIIRSLLDLFSNPERDARQLNRDARRIIDDTVHAYREEQVRVVVARTRTVLDEYEAAVALRPERAPELMRELRRSHRESRRRLDSAGLTAYTLAIIHVRGRAYGEAAAPAREAIEQFVAGSGPDLGPGAPQADQDP